MPFLVFSLKLFGETRLYEKLSLDADIYLASPDGTRLYVSEDVGIVPVTVASTATTDIEAFLYFKLYCKSYNHSTPLYKTLYV